MYDSIFIYMCTTVYSSTCVWSETHHTCRHVMWTRPTTVYYCVFIHIWRANVSTSLCYYMVLRLIHLHIYSCVFIQLWRANVSAGSTSLCHTRHMCIHSHVKYGAIYVFIHMCIALYVYSFTRVSLYMCIHSHVTFGAICVCIHTCIALYVYSSTRNIWRHMCIHSHVTYGAIPYVYSFTRVSRRVYSTNVSAESTFPCHT